MQATKTYFHRASACSGQGQSQNEEALISGWTRGSNQTICVRYCWQRVMGDTRFATKANAKKKKEIPKRVSSMSVPSVETPQRSQPSWQAAIPIRKPLSGRTPWKQTCPLTTMWRQLSDGSGHPP